MIENFDRYVNPKGSERITYPELCAMQEGDPMRLHSGSVRAYVTFEHSGTGTGGPFVKLRKIEHARDKRVHFEGAIIEADQQQLYRMPAAIEEASLPAAEMLPRPPVVPTWESLSERYARASESLELFQAIIECGIQRTTDKGRPAPIPLAQMELERCNALGEGLTEGFAMFNSEVRRGEILQHHLPIVSQHIEPALQYFESLQRTFQYNPTLLDPNWDGPIDRGMNLSHLLPHTLTNAEADTLKSLAPDLESTVVVKSRGDSSIVNALADVHALRAFYLRNGKDTMVVVSTQDSIGVFGKYNLGAPVKPGIW